MKKVTYIIRIMLFIMQFYLLFLIIDSFLRVKPLIFIFLPLYIIYVLKIIFELLSKKKSYKEDLVYNFMQIGMYIYIGIIFYRIYFGFIVPSVETMTYFSTNFGVLIILIIFSLTYSFLELKGK